MSKQTVKKITIDFDAKTIEFDLKYSDIFIFSGREVLDFIEKREKLGYNHFDAALASKEMGCDV